MLTKKHVLSGTRCLKAAYLHYHSPELATPLDEFAQRLLDQGQEVGEVARKRWPDGVLIPWTSNGATAAVEATQKAIADCCPAIFEATFLHDDVFVRVDILLQEEGGHAIVEVKSSTKVKDEHRVDVATQWWVLSQSGVPPTRASVLHIDNKATSDDPWALLREVDVTTSVREMQGDLARTLASVRSTIHADVAPTVPLGRHCTSGSECQFFAHCRSSAGLPSPSLLDLPRLGRDKWKVFEATKGALPNRADPKFHAITKRALRAHRSGQPVVEKSPLASAIGALSYPLLHLDFETWSCAVPRIAGTNPYAHIPIQFSLHVELDPQTEPVHFEHIDVDPLDPRPGLAIVLAQALEKFDLASGTITAWYKSVEKSALEMLADCATEVRVARILRSAIERLVDPLPIVQGHVYDPGFGDSFSLKSVSKALLGSDFDYSKLAISDGAAAMVQYEKLRSPKTSAGERQQIEKNLRDYCRQDTLAVMEIVRKLRSLAGMS